MCHKMASRTKGSATATCPRASVARRARKVAKREARAIQGAYGTFEIDREDEKEVAVYRGALTTAAVCAGATLGALQWLPNEALQTNANALDALWMTANASLAVATVMIHIYVKPLKQFLQVLCGLGALGALGVHLRFPDEAIALSFSEHAWTTLAVGPAFAALTGIAFKEGVCYGKTEAFALFVLTPIACLSHLASAPEQAQATLWGLWAVIFATFAARKYTQEVAEDVGDKSVFWFLSLPEEEQAKVLANMQNKTVVSIDE